MIYYKKLILFLQLVLPNLPYDYVSSYLKQIGNQRILSAQKKKRFMYYFREKKILSFSIKSKQWYTLNFTFEFADYIILLMVLALLQTGYVSADKYYTRIKLLKKERERSRCCVSDTETMTLSIIITTIQLPLLPSINSAPFLRSLFLSDQQEQQQQTEQQSMPQYCFTFRSPDRINYSLIN